ncbi:MAG: hypothetical protein H7Z75_14235 [Ferruginibacter sp.]|nr:hypothetical protein [Cytophagales bacterium]
MSLEYEFLKIYLSQDYSDEKTRVKSDDKENLALARAIKAKREVELLKGEHGLNRKDKKAKANFLEFLEQQIRLKKQMQK